MRTNAYRTMVMKSALAAVGAVMVAAILAISPALANDGYGRHHGHDRHDALPIARHDHGYAQRDDIVHRHSGYGRHVHLAPRGHGGHAAHHAPMHRQHDHKSLKKKKKVKSFLKLLGAVSAAERR